MKATLRKTVKKCERPNGFGLLVIVAGFLLNITFGLCYSHGNITPYIISYTRRYSLDPSRESVSLSSAPWISGGVLVSRALFVPLGGWLSKKIGTRFTTILGGIVIVTSVFLTALTVQLSFWAVVLTYAVLVGLGEGLAHNSILQAAVEWVPQYKGIVLGLLLAGLGLSPFVFIPMQTTLINPNNLQPEHWPDTSVDFTYFLQDDVLDRVPSAFVCMGSVMLALQLVSFVFIVEPRGVCLGKPVNFFSLVKYMWKTLKPLPYACFKKCGESLAHSQMNGAVDNIPNADQSPPVEKHEQETNFGADEGDNPNDCVNRPVLSNDVSSANNSNTSAECEKADSKNCNKGTVQVTPLQLLKRWDFYLFWLAYALLGIPNVYVVAEYKVFGQEFIFDDHVLAWIGSAASIMYFFGRFIWAFLTDPLDAKSVLVVVGGGVTALMFTLYSSSVTRMYSLWICLLYFWLGGVVTVFPCCTAAWYGSDHFATNFGIAYSSQVIAGIVAMILPALGHLNIGWAGEMLSVGGLSLVAVVLIIIAGNRKVKKKKQDKQ